MTILNSAYPYYPVENEPTPKDSHPERASLHDRFFRCVWKEHPSFVLFFFFRVIQIPEMIFLQLEILLNSLT